MNGGETFPAVHDGEEIPSHPRAHRNGRKVSGILLLLFDLLLNPRQIGDQAIAILPSGSLRFNTNRRILECNERRGTPARMARFMPKRSALFPA